MEVAEYINQLFQQNKEMDDIYHKAAVHFGMSDTALWVLYMIVHAKEPVTQQDLCRTAHFPKQTINSVINNLVTNGSVVLETLPGTRKSKRIILTDAGEKLVEDTINKLLEAEIRAYGRFSKEELQNYLDMSARIATFLREETEEFIR